MSKDSIVLLKKDSRYAVNLEWCGESTRQHVARFCGDWIGSYKSEFAAWIAADLHNQGRMEPYVKQNNYENQLS